jgi:hypothetical protein
LIREKRSRDAVRCRTGWASEPEPRAQHLAARRPLQRCLLATKDAPWTEVRVPSERSEDVPHVVRCLDALREPLVPLAADAVHDLRANDAEILDGRVEAVQPEEEVVCGALARERPVEVGRGAHHDHAGEVDEPGQGTAEERLERAVVLLLRRAVHARAVGEQLRRVFECLAEERPGPEVVGRRRVACNDRRRSRTGGERRDIGVVRPIGSRGVVVEELYSLHHLDDRFAEGVVDLDDFGTVDIRRVLVGKHRALRNVARRRIGGLLARVELKLQGNLNGVARESHAADCANFGVYASDTGNEEVRVLEVEDR